MATSTRQYGRRGVGNLTSAGGGIAPSSSAGSVSTPPRRYVLDVPRGRTNRMRTTTRLADEYDVTNTRSRSAGGATTYSTLVTSGIDTESGELLSRSGSREYYYRDGGSDTSAASMSRYLEDGAVRQLVESNVTYANSAMEDQEVQALTAQATPDVKNYPINVDANPEMIVRPNNQRLTYTQDIAVRYLKPGTPPPPGPIIIREIRAPAPPPAPPIILRQRPPPPRTPSPVIIREKPPTRPKSVPTTVIKKVIPPPPPPPRKLIIERLPKLPPKPRPVIIERWLPYHKQKRQVIHEKAKPVEPMARVKNTIIEWRSPEVEVVRHVKKLGVHDADPQRYYSQHGDKLYATEFVQRKLTELGMQEELALMHEQQNSAAKEEVALEQADEYNVRQILNGYGQSSSSRQTYTTTDEYGEQRMVYDGSSYNFGEGTSRGAVLTEEMLLRSHAGNEGKFPTHLLTKLGSQIYDMPADQVDLSNSAARRTTTATRYYSVNPGETGYESAVDETGEFTSASADNQYVRIKASDLKDVLANYDVFSSTGQKLEGEQLNF